MRSFNFLSVILDYLSVCWFYNYLLLAVYILNYYFKCEFYIFSFRFCVGDRFYLCENKILCEYDYEERLVFANMAYNPPPLSHLKRQTAIPPVSIKMQL